MVFNSTQYLWCLRKFKWDSDVIQPCVHSSNAPVDFFCLVSSNLTLHVYNFFQAKNQGDCMLIFGLICKTPPLLVFSTKSCHLCLPSWHVQLLRLPPPITWSSKCLQAEIQGDCRAHLICFLFLGHHSLVTESSYFWYFAHISHILSSGFLLQEC